MNMIKRIMNMNTKIVSAISLATILVGMAGSVGVANAASNSAQSIATQQKRLQNIITIGNSEINRRLVTLGDLTTKINAATKLTTSDKATLTSEVSTTTIGLTSLKTQLDADTTVTQAHTDAMSIYSEYRVYALVAPKVDLVKVADDQQVIESEITSLIPKLQSRITVDQQAGKNVTTLQSELNDMSTKTSVSSGISTKIESTVINLLPSDYNSNHTLLSGDNGQLNIAHNDNIAAETDANNIAIGLKNL
jgi:hypothetical protein